MNETIGDNVSAGAFAATLNRIMEERRLSVKEIAKATDIAKSTISEWRSGRKPQVGEDLVRLARFLGVSVDHLITGREAENDLIEKVINSVGNEFIQVFQGTYKITIEKKSS